jgi:hypothetical protein
MLEGFLKYSKKGRKRGNVKVEKERMRQREQEGNRARDKEANPLFIQN